MTRRAIVAAACAALVALSGAAAVLAASPVPGTLGARVVPAPVRLDDGTRSLVVTNLAGGLVERFTLTTDDPSFTVEPSHFELAPEESQTVNLVTVGPGDAKLTVRAEATTRTASANVTSAIVLEVGLRWASPLEKMVAQYGPYVPLGALAALTVALCALWTILRRRRTPC